MAGTRGTPGHSWWPTASAGPVICGVSGGGGETGLFSPAILMWMAGSSTTLASVAMTASGASPGRIRQLTLAVARCGRAFSAWPALTMVATQVVRIMEL